MKLLGRKHFLLVFMTLFHLKPLIGCSEGCESRDTQTHTTSQMSEWTWWLHSTVWSPWWGLTWDTSTQTTIVDWWRQWHCCEFSASCDGPGVRVWITLDLHQQSHSTLHHKLKDWYNREGTLTHTRPPSPPSTSQSCVFIRQERFGGLGLKCLSSP